MTSTNQSTPISELTSNNDNNLVQDILKELGESKQVEISQIQQIQQTQQQLQEPQQIPTLQQPILNSIPQMQQMQQQVIPSLLQKQEQIQQPTLDGNKKLLYNILKKFKGPLIVFTIAFALSFSFVNKSLIKYIPRLGTDDSLNLSGNLVKGLVASIFYFISNKFI